MYGYRYGINLIDAQKFGIRKGLVGGGGMGLVYVIVFGVYAAAFAYGSKLYFDGEYTVGQVLIVCNSDMYALYAVTGNVSSILMFTLFTGVLCCPDWCFLTWKCSTKSAESRNSKGGSVHHIQYHRQGTNSILSLCKP